MLCEDVTSSANDNTATHVQPHKYQDTATPYTYGSAAQSVRES
jgi:hypothetical protein